MAASSQRVLFAHSYFLAYDAKQTRKMKPYPPLATLMTAAVARQRGCDVTLFDAMLSGGEEEFERVLDETRPAVVALFEDNFNFLTKMCTTRMREAALTMIRASKERGCRVAVNGSDASDNPDVYLGAGADTVIRGETEKTFPELLDAWAAGASDLRHIPGLTLPPGRTTAARPFVEELDALPLPAWDLVNVPLYRAAWTAAHGRLSWNVVTTRGCPFHCNWCAKPLYGTRYAQRSPENVADELLALSRQVAPDHVWFADDIFGLTPRWIERFAEEVSKRGVRIPFTMQSRVDLMTPSGVEALAHAGAEEVWLGVESGSQQILNAMDKGTRQEQIRHATRRLREHGIRAAWFLQLGYPGEEWSDILLTRDLVRSERPDDVGVSVAYPLPGTLFFERVKDQLSGQRNWEDSDDLAMLFQGTFTGSFYKKVRDLLHQEASTQTPDDAAWDELDAGRHEHRSEQPVTLPTSEAAAAP